MIERSLLGAAFQASEGDGLVANSFIFILVQLAPWFCTARSTVRVQSCEVFCFTAVQYSRPNLMIQWTEDLIIPSLLHETSRLLSTAASSILNLVQYCSHSVVYDLTSNSRRVT